MSETIRCLNCEKDSEIIRDENDGINAFKAQEINWIVKNPFIYNGKNDWCYYCSDDCKNTHYSKHINLTKEEKKFGDGIIKKAKRELY